MKKQLSLFRNYKLLVFSAILFVYFYFMLQNFYTGELSSVAVLCVFYIISATVPFLFRYKQGDSKLVKKLIPWFFWSIFLCIIHFNSLGQMTSSVLWISAFLVSYGLLYRKSDIFVVTIFVTFICFLSLAMGAVNLGMGTFINVAALNNSDYDMNENIGAFILITIPMIMLISNRLLRWIILVITLIVIILTARRTATICYIFIFILNVIQDVRSSTNKRGFMHKFLIPTLLFTLIGYGVYTLMTSDFAPALERTVDRFLEMGDDAGSGRTVLYKDVWNAFLDGNIFQIIVGHGYHGVSRFTNHTAAHNDFLQYLFDYGVIGILFYCSLHIFFIKRVFYLYKNKNNLFFSYAASYCIFLFYGMFGNIIIYPQYFLTLPVYWGVAEKIIAKKMQYE